ncbi:hypothetical protein TEA_011849 [Camellia sinensis var. sinensis]|uniref:Tryptophan synthase beta chain-like PALP domain-containing protein n=1 Tax=Camellia sinensis var. sinensis TaxID=542762 RepID=A0A4S4E835_CAMSN|nr:hypothetical protein TEA_011849 [Camellia sinensis var. sinensis]
MSAKRKRQICCCVVENSVYINMFLLGGWTVTELDIDQWRGYFFPVETTVSIGISAIHQTLFSKSHRRSVEIEFKRCVLRLTSRSNLSVTAMEAPPQTKQPHNNSFEFDGFLSNKPYNPPSWASHLNPIPSHIFSFGNFPAPIHKWNLPNLPNNTQVWLKRDDLSGMQFSGNKVRKLEFLMADAVAQGADCVITIGAIQSNHCRATAVAAKYLNLDCYLILFTSKVLVDKDPGLTGNLLVERLVGAHIDLVSKEEYAKIGSLALTSLLKEKLVSEGRKPYVIPVGGSNSLGTWGFSCNALDPKTQNCKPE